MTWINQLLFKLSAYCRCRVINGPDRQAYLERYFLMRLPLGYRVYLHRFVASDPGRGLHNHPWRHAVSLLLCGEYEETRMRDARADNALYSRRIRAGRCNFISGGVFHRINIDPGSECWSLFIHARKASSWGFLQAQGYRDHNLVLERACDSDWWKQACRPIQSPQMRLPCA